MGHSIAVPFPVGSKVRIAKGAQRGKVYHRSDALRPLDNRKPVKLYRTKHVGIVVGLMIEQIDDTVYQWVRVDWKMPGGWGGTTTYAECWHNVDTLEGIADGKQAGEGTVGDSGASE